MMRTLLYLFTGLFLTACPPTDYSWQYRYDLSCTGYTDDLDVRMVYTSAQHRLGIPMDSLLLANYGGYPNGYDWGSPPSALNPYELLERHPVRNPTRVMNLNGTRHPVDNGYTGFPGYFDY